MSQDNQATLDTIAAEITKIFPELPSDTTIDVSTTASDSAHLQKQLKKLRKQVKRLKRELRDMEEIVASTSSTINQCLAEHSLIKHRLTILTDHMYKHSS